MLHHLLTHVAQNIDVPLPNPGGVDNGSVIQKIINLVLEIMGAAALLVITMAGFRFTISRGNPQQVTQAREAIMYSLIGLIVIISAFVIVNFVIFKLR